MDVSIIGVGSWGSALALVLSENKNCNISMYHYNDYYVNKTSFKYLEKTKIPKNVLIKSDLEDIQSKDIIFIALPTKYIHSVIKKIMINSNNKSAESNNRPIWVNCSKGFDLEKNEIFSVSLIKDFGIDINKFVILSGPSHAEEVAKKIPTAVVSSCKSKESSSLVQSLLSNNYFRVYTNTDIVGVQIGGACKNIISIAAGICIGLGYGDNTISALISRGLQEIIRLGIILDANKNTFYGLSGLGDLSVTAFGKFSRNREFGIKLGQGKSMKKSQSDIKMVIEGIDATKAVYEISQKHKINMPIVEQVYSILFNNKNPKLAINELMDRKLKDEMI
jgi:glycerol-3-phosphate dehydrogenase (NAD(P)+)